MKSRIFFFALGLCLAFHIQAQEIIKTMKGYVLIRMTASKIIQPGDTFEVGRYNNSSNVRKIGKVRALKIKDNRCAAKIIRQDTQIRTGDFIIVSEDAVIDQMFEDSDPNQSPQRFQSYRREQVTGSNRSLWYTLLGIGALSVGYGGYSYGQANAEYEHYEKATNQSDAVKYYDNSVQLDKHAQIGFWIGGGLIALSFYQLVFNKPTPHPTYSINVTPGKAQIRFSYVFNF